jgi:predicted RNA methylase
MAATDKTNAWPDLSIYGVELLVFKTPDGRQLLTIYGDVTKIDYFRERLADQLGFKTTRSGYMSRTDLKITKQQLERVFPRVPVAMRSVGEIVRSTTSKVTKPGEQPKERINPKVIASAPIGYNHLGQEVLDGENGRFIRDGDAIRLEEDTLTPADFLRGVDADSVALCADGFVRSISERGIIYRPDDIRKFAAHILGVAVDQFHPRLREVQEAIEAAAVRSLSAAHTAPNDAAFHNALALYEAAPSLIFRTSSSIELQQYSTPLPMAVIVQRLLGEVAGKTVVEPAIGNGSLVSLLASSGANVVGYDLDPARVDAVKRLYPEADIRHGNSLQSNIPECDFVVANPPFGGLDKPINMDGMRVTRIDHQMLLSALKARKDDGRAVFIIGADKMIDSQMHKVVGGSRYLFNWLADNYDVEAVTTVDGGLYSGQGAGYPVRIVVVGKRGKEFAHKQVPDELPVIRSYEELTEWADGILAKRAADAEIKAKPPAPEPVVEKAEKQTLSENHYQAPYITHSRLGESSTMIPRNMLGAQSAAFANLQQRLQETHGEFGEEVDFDAYVADSVGIAPEELGKYFSPEQSDLLAMGISQLNKGRGIIVGDETGIGKGRTLAGFVRWAQKQEKPIVFSSEKGNLFSDFYRDLIDTGADVGLKPMILNDGVVVFDTNFKKLHVSTARSVVQSLITKDESPATVGYNGTLSTYSQFNKDKAKSPKSGWLNKLCEGALVILDESHNAAGDSNIGRNITSAIEKAAAVVYSSATFAKKADNMGVYAKVFPESVDTNSLPETLKKGGEPLLEVLSAALCEDGVLMRREHDLSTLDVTTEHPSPERLKLNRAYADKFAEIVSKMSYYSGDCDSVISSRQREIKKEAAKLPEEVRKGSRMGVTSTNFGSRLYNLQQQFLLAIKTPDAIEQALKALEEGRKPVIMTETTQEALLRDFLISERTADLEDGLEDVESGDEQAAKELEAKVAAAQAAYLGEEGLTLDEPITFRDVLRRTLARLHTVVERDRYGEATRKNVWDLVKDKDQADALQAAITEMELMISEFPDLPVSPLDVIREALEAKGYSCREISGRSLGVTTRQDGTMALVSRDDSKHRVRTNYDFNNGKVDAVILTTAGSTGLSLHSLPPTERNPNLDPRQRDYIELKIPNNVATRKQGFGRVNRKGQVSAPKIRTLSSGLPAEQRVMAMQNAKLRKMSSSTTGSRENVAEDREVLDVINPIGNEVCRRYLENNPGLAAILGIEASELEAGNESHSEDDAYFANRVFSRIGLLTCAAQDKVLEEVTQEFREVVREMEARGESPFKLKELDLKATVVGRKLFDGVEEETYASVFDKPVYLTTIEYRKTVEPMSMEEISRRAEESLEEMIADKRSIEPKDPKESYWYAQNFVAPWIVIARKNVSALQEQALAGVRDKFETIEEALRSTEHNPIKAIEARFEMMQGVLSRVLPGGVVRIVDKIEGEKICVITSLTPPAPNKEHYLGQWEIKMVPIGDSKPLSFSLKMIAEMEPDHTRFKGNILFSKGSHEAVSSAVSSFGTKKKEIIFRRQVLDGNLFRAAQMAAERNLGDTVIYTQEDGSRHSAVLTRAALSLEDLMTMPVKLPNMRVATELLLSGNKNTVLSNFSLGNEGDVENAVTVRIMDDGQAMIQVPGSKSRGGNIYLDNDLREVVGDFSGGRTWMRASFRKKDLEEALNIMNKRLKVSFFVPHQLRERVEYITTKFNAERRGDDEAPVAKAA